MEGRKQTIVALIISLIIFILVVSIFVAGYSIWQKKENEKVNREGEKDLTDDFRLPPVVFCDGSIKGNYSIGEAIDKLVEERISSEAMMYIFDSSMTVSCYDLAKGKMGDEKYGRYFSNANIEWNVEHESYTVKGAWTYHEKLEICPMDIQNLKIVLTKEQFATPQKGSIVTGADGREYYEEKTDTGKKYTVDLGGNTKYCFEISTATENADEIINSLLEYGFMLKDSVPERKENTYK